MADLPQADALPIELPSAVGIQAFYFYNYSLKFLSFEQLTLNKLASLLFHNNFDNLDRFTMIGFFVFLTQKATTRLVFQRCHHVYKCGMCVKP